MVDTLEHAAPAGDALEQAVAKARAQLEAEEAGQSPEPGTTDTPADPALEIARGCGSLLFLPAFLYPWNSRRDHPYSRRRGTLLQRNSRADDRTIF